MPPRTRIDRLSGIRSTRQPATFRKLLKRYPRRTSIVCEGDSWFAYPREWIFAGKPNNIVDHLKDRERFNLLQLASSGDEAVAMLSGGSKLKLIELIHETRIDFLLFSGGGNDIVGAYDMPFFLRDGRGAATVDECLNLPRLQRRLEQIGNAYRDLVEFCDSYSLNEKIVVVTHTYDYAVPSPAGATFLGGLFDFDGGTSWMWPYMEHFNIPKELRRGIVRMMIRMLAETLLMIAGASKGRLSVVDTRESLDPDKHWLNEIHPDAAGFGIVTDLIYGRIRRLRGA